MTPTDKVLSHLEQVRERGEGRWLACCPAHEDRHPSLGIKECPDGTVLLQCYSQGCSVVDITNAIELSVADLFVKTPKPYHPSLPAPLTLSVQEATIILNRESLIVAIGFSDFVRGKALSEADAHRVLQAAMYITEVRCVMGW